MEILDTLFRSVFFGFIVWTIVWVLTKRSQIIGYRTEDVDGFVVGITMAFGVVHLAFLTTNFIEWDNGVAINESTEQRAFGKYWFGFWIYPFTYFGLTQLLWSYKIRKNKGIRVVMAVWTFAVMHLEKFLIFTTTIMHKEFSPEGTIEVPMYILRQVGTSWLAGIAIFATIIIIGMKVKTAVQRRA